jgi:DNA (cytosine-5)-methyltransferase 1
MMVHGDLFSGIGGFSLAARWMGWRTAWFSEIDPFASRVLAHHWPDVLNYGDITRIDWATVEPVDILTAGFPCQPHSVAGLRKASHDNRDLSGEVVRAIGSLRPRWALLENVPGLLGSERGQFFRRFLGQVTALGYDAEWGVLSASDVGAPHKRERLWIVAYPAKLDHADWGRRKQRDAQERRDEKPLAGHLSVGDSDGERGRGWRERQDAGNVGASSEVVQCGQAWADAVPAVGHDGTTRFIPADAAARGPESPLWPVAHGVSGRVAQLRALGNAIVPQCAYQIFQHIAAAPGRTETR